MNVEYKQFDIKRNFGVEFEVSAVKLARSCPSFFGHSWTDSDGIAHPKIKRQFLRDVISTASPREVCITDWCQSVENNYWHIKYDSTCGPLGKSKAFTSSPGGYGGWEIASFKASGAEDIAHISEVANVLREAEVEVNNNCGLHVHADASDFMPTEVAIAVARWLKIEPWVCQMVPPHRRKNKYCKLMKNYLKLKEGGHDPDLFWTLIRPNNLDIHDNPQKKVAFNLVNYTAALRCRQNPDYYDYDTAKRQTLEFRLPEGTLDGIDVANWVYFFLLFVELSKKSVMPENYKAERSLERFFTYFGLEDDNSIILGKNLFDLKKWMCYRLIEWGGIKYKKEAEKKLKLFDI